jgi:hypothetical protein
MDESLGGNRCHSCPFAIQATEAQREEAANLTLFVQDEPLYRGVHPKQRR